MPITPYVVHRTEDSERYSDLFSALLEDRIIFLGEQVTDAVASSIVAQLLYLENRDPEKDVYLYINSPGGSVTAGMAIYDTMQHIKPDVNTICVGMAASMGAFLLAGGAKGKRMALPNSEVMIHQPSAGTHGQVTDMVLHVKHFEQNKIRLNRILAANVGRFEDEVAVACERDNYMTSEEALSFGLIDKILE